MGNAVIPHGNGILAPSQTHLKLGFGHVLIKVLQNAVTLPLNFTHNMAGKRFVNIEVFKAPNRMGIKHFVHGRTGALPTVIGRLDTAFVI